MMPLKCGAFPPAGPAAARRRTRCFGLLYRDLSPAAPREHAVFYTHCSVFEDLAYGLDSGRSAYTAKCLAALDWLFHD